MWTYGWVCVLNTAVDYGNSRALSDNSSGMELLDSSQTMNRVV